MQIQDYPRFNRSIENAIQDLYRDAKCFCYHETPEFKSLIEKMRGHQELLKMLQKEQESNR